MPDIFKLGVRAWNGDEYAQGQLLGMLPGLYGGFKAARANIGSAVSEGLPNLRRLSNVQAREWYLKQEAKIPSLLDKTAILEAQAKTAFNLRNAFRTFARELMSDRAAAEGYYKSDPNLTWDQIVQKYKDKGLSGDALYQGIIDASQRSRTSVNESVGIKPPSGEGKSGTQQNGKTGN